MDTDSLKRIIESLLFVADVPVTTEDIKNIVGEVNSREIDLAIEELIAEINSLNRSFYVARIAGGYQLRTREEFSPWIRRYLHSKPARLTRPALETLAIVAYKQPVTRTEIESIRGVDSGGVLKTLLERKLIRIIGRLEVPGRPLVYGTTREFLELFGLKDIKDMPTLKDYEDLARELREKKVEGLEDIDIDSQLKLYEGQEEPVLNNKMEKETENEKE